MTTLTLCIGMFLYACGSVRTFDFPDYASCDRERAAQVAHIKDGYAVCAPKAKEPQK
jgi:hypothetical protein